MKRYALIFALSVLALATIRGAALAQAPAVGDPAQMERTLVEGPGVSVGEGTVLHPTVGVETGFNSNIFYDDQALDSAPFMRALVELNIASLSKQRLSDGSEVVEEDQGDLEWRAGGRLIAQQYISDNPNITAQHNIGAGLNLHALVFPNRPWKFQADEDYVRDNRPTNFESSRGLDRDVNNLMLQVRWEPHGRALSGAVRYQNLVDVFESANESFANRIQHTIGARVNWQWLPITQLYADVSLGIFEPLGSSSNRVPSMPLRALLGIRTAITTNTAITMRAGYGNGFYARGSSPSQPIFGVAATWRYTPNGLLQAGYYYDFSDSIQANYFRDHAFYASENHQFDNITVTTAVDLRFRNSQSVNIPGVMAPERSDFLFDFGISPRYYIKDWFAATLDYDTIVDSTDFRYMTDGITVNPSFIRHQVMAGVRAAW